MICGHVEHGYEKVAAAFCANFDEGREVGAALCIYADGHPVVDVWGGLADTDAGSRWEARTAQLVFSTTKGVTALCVLRLVEQGSIELDAPIARYWPEFGANGKGRITPRMVLSHRAGLPSVDGDFSLEDVLDGTPVLRALEAQAPAWTPGSTHGYHGHTYGWILGELVRRVTGRTLGQHLADEIAAPLALDLWIGMPEAAQSSVARLIEPAHPADAPGPEMVELLRMVTVNGALAGSGDAYPWNSRALRASEMPAVNGIASAHALARLYAACLEPIDGYRVIGSPIVAEARRQASFGTDAMLGAETRFGLGFALTSKNIPWLGPDAFGFAGAGGSFAFADPDNCIAMAYVANRLGNTLFLDPRATRLIDATRELI